MDLVVKRLRNATLGNNRPSDATASSGGLADADVDDVESLERLRDEARRACLEQMDSHLTQYLFEEQDGCRRRTTRSGSRRCIPRTLRSRQE